MAEKFTFFWDGVFSQWYPSDFTFDELKFNCAEQFMMFCKSVRFGDFENTAKIIVSTNPSEQKKLGRQVKDFKADDWNHIARQVVYVASYLKFSNPTLLPKLLETDGTTLVEASPYDKIWGIGLYSSDPRAQKRETWNGTNWLGEILTQVREDLKHNRKNQDAFEVCGALFMGFEER